jgi:hypothetical protein
MPTVYICQKEEGSEVMSSQNDIQNIDVSVKSSPRLATSQQTQRYEHPV